MKLYRNSSYNSILYCYNSVNLNLYQTIYVRDSSKSVTPNSNGHVYSESNKSKHEQMFKKLCVLCLTNKTYSALEGKNAIRMLIYRRHLSCIAFEPSLSILNQHY